MPVVAGRQLFSRFRLAHAVQPVTRHIAQLAGAVQVQYALQHKGGVAAVAQQRGISRNAFFVEHQLYAAEPFVDRLQIEHGDPVPKVRRSRRA